MSETPQIVDKDGNEFSTSIFGIPIKARGPMVTLLLVVLASTGVIIFGLESQNVLLKEQMSAHAMELAKHDTSLNTDHDLLYKQMAELQGTMKAQLFIMCQGNAECRKFDLQMPQALREMPRRY